MRDPIIEELHHLREENAKRHNFNAEAMLRDFMRRQQAGNRTVRNLHQERVSAAPALGKQG